MTSIFKSTLPIKSCTKLALIVLLFALPYVSFAQSANANQPVFNHAALCAKNLRKTAAFYTNVMQLQTIHHPFNDTLHVWLKIGEGLALHIIQGDCAETTHNIGIHLCFSVPSLSTFIKHLDEMNVPYGNWTGQAKKIQVRADGVNQIYIQDPDGFWVEVNDSK